MRKKNVHVYSTWYTSLVSSKVKKRELISVITGLTDPNPFFAAEFLLNSYNDTVVQNRFWIRNIKNYVNYDKIYQKWNKCCKIYMLLDLSLSKFTYFSICFVTNSYLQKGVWECNFRKNLIQKCKGDDYTTKLEWKEQCTKAATVIQT